MCPAGGDVSNSIPPLATIKLLKFNTLDAARRVLRNVSYQL
jgi:hypothetical protein